MAEPPYILWSRTLSPDQWERWRSRADAILARDLAPGEHAGTALGRALQAAYEEMTREAGSMTVTTVQAVYAVLDLETGGLDPETCAIGSVAVMTLDQQYREVTRYQRLVADEPARLWTLDAIAVNGLDPARCRREGTPIGQVLSDLKAGLPGKLVVAHNARFDLSFLAARGIAVPEWICTLELARRYCPGRSLKLGAVADRLKVAKGTAHEAMGDVETTANVFRELMRRAGK